MADIEQHTDPEHIGKIRDILHDQGGDSAGDEDLLVLTTGVVLRTHRVSPFLYNQLLERFTDPPVPTVYDKDSEREIKNPMDPDYRRMLAQVDMDRGTALTDLFIGLGTTIEHVPEGILPPDDNRWVGLIGRHISREEYDAVMEDESYRYIAWVKYIATSDAQDIASIMEAINRKLGVRAEAVAEELEKFRGDATRYPD